MLRKFKKETLSDAVASQSRVAGGLENQDSHGMSKNLRQPGNFREFIQKVRDLMRSAA